MTNQEKDKIVGFLKQGYPQSTATALARVEFDEFKKEYAADKEFRLDVNEADAIGVRDQIDMLKQFALDDYKPAIEFLKKRDKANWADQTKLELSIEQGRQEVLDDLERRLPTELFKQVIEYLINE